MQEIAKWKGRQFVVSVCGRGAERVTGEDAGRIRQRCELSAQEHPLLREVLHNYNSE